MNLIVIYFTFLKISLLGFGGGLAMIPLLQKAIVDPGYLSKGEFLDLVTLSQSTPGSLIINVASYIGYRLHGLPGAFTATFAIVTPCFVFIYFLYYFLHSKRFALLKDSLLSIIQPVVSVMFVGAALLILNSFLALDDLALYKEILIAISFLVAWLCIATKKVSVFLLLAVYAVLGIFLF